MRVPPFLSTRALPVLLVGLFLLLVADGVGAQSAVGPGGWQPEIAVDLSEPSARHEAAYVAYDGLFYLLGGRGGRPVDRYDPLARTWTDLGNPHPGGLHHFQPVVFGDTIWILSSFQGPFPNETTVGQIRLYDPALNQWSGGSAIPAGRARGSGGAARYGDALYVVGGNTQGHDGGYVPWFDRYEPLTDTWTVLPDAPHARDHFTAVVVGNRLIVAGGRQTELPNPFLNTVAAVDVYDFSTGQWSSFPQPIPTERAGAMTVARGEHVIVVGGETAAAAQGATEALDVTTGEWTTLPSLLDSRHSGGAVLYEDAIYVAAGSGNTGGFPELSTQERLDLTGLLPTSASQLLTNGDFDLGLVGWTDDGDLTLVAADGSIAAPCLDVENGWAGQTVPADALETYTLAGVYQALGGAGDVSATLEFFAGATLLGEVEQVLGPTDGFTSFELRGTTPAGTTQVRARFDARIDRVLRLDDVVLRETPAEVPRLGVPANPWALRPSTNGPLTNSIYDPRIDHTEFAPGATLDVLIVGFFPLNLTAAPGTLLVDLGLVVYVFAAPGNPLLFGIPPDPALAGIPLVVQGASVGPGTQKRFTNALDLTLQVP